jgi:hypothetical protein
VDEGLLSTDLLLQAGGFSIIVLDLSDIHPQQLMRVKGEAKPDHCGGVKVGQWRVVGV